MRDTHPHLPIPMRPGKDLFVSTVGICLPTDLVTNDEFVRRSGLTTGMATRAQWIEARTGIRERRWASPDQSASDLGAEAARDLFSKDSLLKSTLRHVVFSTTSGDFPSPPTAPRLQYKLGLVGSGCYDLGAACAGFTAGLQFASSLVLSTGESVLLIASDIRSKFLDLRDYNTAPLFGDGAAAVCLSLNRPMGISFKLLAVRSFADGQWSDVIMIPGGGSAPERVKSENGKFYLTMFDGTKIFLKAREALGRGSEFFLNELGFDLSSIRYFVPHQANALILKEVKKDLNLRDDQVIETVATTGNTAGASTGIALAKLIQERELNAGDLVLMAAAGGGGIVSHALLECVR